MRIVLLGPQGSGKGTQGQRLAEITGARHLASGDLVRAEISAGTQLGQTIRAYNDRGELVPDEIILQLVRPRLVETERWILDGFPRDEAQALALDTLLVELRRPLDGVIVLEAPDALLEERILGRVQSAATGRIYHLTLNPPPPSDPGPFVRRTDDTPSDIRRRLEIYHRETEPLKQYYARQGLVTVIDALAPMDDVTAAILRAVHAEEAAK